MEIYFPIMITLICIFLGMGVWKLATGQREIDRKPDPVPSRPRPKPVAPFPFGPISDLIKDAEARAEKEFFELFPEERPKPDPPGGYSMDSSPDGIIVSNGVMTPDEWRERYQLSKSHGMMVLSEDVTYHPLRTVDVESFGMPYSRYIEGIGMIRAETRDKLDRACEVALKQKFDENAAALRSCDKVIDAAKRTGRTMDLTKTREIRLDAWEKCKLYLDLLQELNL